jgi:4-diphosphocytidyl-2-C-methyl-D-erythritol kinase
MLKAYSYAKVNLFLYVLSRRNDNYHDLYSLVTRVNLFDYISVEKSAQFKIKCNIASLSTNENNILYKLYLKVEEKFNITPCSIILYKNIPIGAGLGGGSSNAAALLELLVKLYKLTLTLSQKISLLSSISADAPYFLHKGARIISGIGDKISDPINIPKFYILLIKPSYSIATREIYESGLVNITKNMPSFPIKEFNYGELIAHAHNDLEKAIFNSKPDLYELKKLITIKGADISQVTGSGSAIYGVFSSKKVFFNAYRYFQDNFKGLTIYKLTNI